MSKGKFLWLFAVLFLTANCSYKENQLAEQLEGSWRILRYVGDSIVLDTVSENPLVIDSLFLDPLSKKMLVRPDTSMQVFTFLPCPNAYTANCSIQAVITGQSQLWQVSGLLRYSLKTDELSFVNPTSPAIGFPNFDLFRLLRYRLTIEGQRFYLDGISHPWRSIEFQRIQ
jgi:hypothetical protein